MGNGGAPPSLTLFSPKAIEVMGKIGFGRAMVKHYVSALLRNTLGGRYDPDFDREIALRAG
jgi:hypothetical protein